MKALCTGSFDPVTIGHYDYICRAAALFDSVVIAVSSNTNKHCMFSAKDRVRFLKQAFSGFDNVEVVSFDGWAADLAKKYGADVIIKGIRGSTDLDYEATISDVNRKISGVETLYIPSSPAVCHISSTAVREMIKHGKDYRPFIPDGVVIEDGTEDGTEHGKDV